MIVASPGHVYTANMCGPETPVQAAITKIVADDATLKKLDNALNAWGGYFRLLCGRCWDESAIPTRRPMTRARAVRRFYDRGWRCTDVTLCPRCARNAASGLTDVVP